MMSCPVLGLPAGVVHGDGVAPMPFLLVSTEVQPKTVFPSLSSRNRLALTPVKRLAESVHWVFAAFAVTEALAVPTPPERVHSGDALTGTPNRGQTPETAEATGAFVATMPNAAAAMREKNRFIDASFVVMGDYAQWPWPP